MESHLPKYSSYDCQNLSDCAINKRILGIHHERVLSEKRKNMKNILATPRTIFYLLLDTIIMIALLTLPWLSIGGIVSGTAFSIPFNLVSSSHIVGILQFILGVFTSINIQLYYSVLLLFSIVWLIIPVLITIGLVWLFRNRDINQFVIYSRRAFIAALLVGIVLGVIYFSVQIFMTTYLIQLGSNVLLPFLNYLNAGTLSDWGVPAALITIFENNQFIIMAGVQSAVVGTVSGMSNIITDIIFHLDFGFYTVVFASGIGWLVPKIMGWIYNPDEETTLVFKDLMILSKKQKKEQETIRND